MRRNRFSAVLILAAPTMASRRRFVTIFFIPISLVAVSVAIMTQPGQAAPIQPGDADYQYLFDEGTGTTVADTGAAGAGKNASLIGSPAWSTETPFSYAGNNSLSNNGSGAATVDGFNVDMGTQSTVSMWVRYNDQAPGGTQYIHDTPGGTGRFLWYYEANGAPRGDAIYWDTSNRGNAGLSPLTNGQWTHKAIVRDGTDLRVYEDGALIRTDTVGATATTFGGLKLGSRVSNNEFFRGEIDEYAYWTSALTGDNIEWLSQNSLTGAGGGGPEPPTTINLALDKEYAWELHAPGQSPNSGPHYLDDSGNGGGAHAVHSPANNFGAFSLGELTDGVRQAGGAGGAGQPLLGQHGGAPAANIIFDLGELSEVQEIIIGTHITAGANNNAPDDVTISFSTTGSAPGDFGAGTFFDLETMFGPLADGSHNMLLDIADLPAQFVKLSFDGGSMAEPGGSDPNEKWMLDEIIINGSVGGAAVPEPSTFVLAALGLLGLGWYGRRRRRPTC